MGRHRPAFIARCLECQARKNGLTTTSPARFSRRPELPRVRAIADEEIPAFFTNVEPLERQPFAGPLDAVTVEQAIGRPVRATDQVRAVVAQHLARPAVERHRKVLAKIPVRDDHTALVAKQQRHDRKAIFVITESRGPHDTRPELLLAADPNLHRAQSFPGSEYDARAGTETRSRSGNHKPVSQPPYTHPVSRPIA